MVQVAEAYTNTNCKINVIYKSEPVHHCVNLAFIKNFLFGGRGSIYVFNLRRIRCVTAHAKINTHKNARDMMNM
jgi:hypothetical protein